MQAHFEWDMSAADYEKDRNENKHWEIAKRSIQLGGKRDVFLGTRECQGYVEPCQFGEGKGYYDHSVDIPFGLMVHGITYPNEAFDEQTKGKISARLWSPVMKNGIIEFIRPEECPIIRPLRDYAIKGRKENNS